MTPAEEAAFRAGLEAAAAVCAHAIDALRPGGTQGSIIIESAMRETLEATAAAIRALPAPESAEPTAADWAERYRLVCFELCERMGIKPDEIIADSGEEAWMLAGYEATTKQTAAALRAARGQG